MRIKRFGIIAVLILVSVLLTACTFWRSLGEKKHEGKLAVHFLDVGQGDAIFLELPNGKTMLVDSGPLHLGERLVDYIRRAGFDRIDYLVATHPHMDHIGSMAYVVRHCDIGEVWMTAAASNTYCYEDLLDAIKAKGLTVSEGKAGVRLFGADGLSADILAPSVTDEKNLNNCSIVIRLTFGKNTFLLMGDAETEETSAITADLSADVLKVPHHGSNTANSQELIEAVRPEIAVISCGADNDFGHPGKKTLRFLENAGSKIYRTDLDRTVVVVSDGSKLTVETGGKRIAKE